MYVCMCVCTYAYIFVHDRMHRAGDSSDIHCTHIIYTSTDNVSLILQTLHDSATRLQLVVQHYNSITQQLTDTTRLLFHNKLELTEEVRHHYSMLLYTHYYDHTQLITHGLDEITWRSSKLQDFVADSTALISGDLHQVMNSVLERMAKIDSIIDTWMNLGGMTVFDDQSGRGVPLDELQQKHQ